MFTLIRFTSRVRQLACAAGLLAAVAGAAPAGAVSINIGNFGGPTNQALMQINGSACFSTTCPNAGTALRLTPNEPGQAGSAFYNQGFFVPRDTDIDTSFKFRINSPGRGVDERADGLAFVIQGGGPGFIGGSGGNLGYMNSSSPTGGYFYAIEFDTFGNASTNDISDNHVSVTRTEGGVTQVLRTVNLNALPVPKPPMDNGEVKNVRIEFNSHGIDNNLLVFLSEGAGAVEQLVLNMVLPDDVFHFGGASTFFGFTASTGDRYASHDILSWTLNIPEPDSLPLLAIGAGAMLVLGRWQRRVGRC